MIAGSILAISESVETVCIFDAGNRTTTNHWEDVRLQPPEVLVSIIGGTSVLPIVVPFARDRFEGIAIGDLSSPFTLTSSEGPTLAARLRLA